MNATKSFHPSTNRRRSSGVSSEGNVRRLLSMGLVCAALLPHGAFAQLANSGTVTVGEVVRPLSIISQDRWSLRTGDASTTVSSSVAPDGSPLMEISARTAGGILVQHDLSTPSDLRTSDSFTFFIRSSATRIGDYVYLVDRRNRRRWFPLILRSWRGW